MQTLFWSNRETNFNSFNSHSSFNNVNDDISIYRDEMVRRCSVSCEYHRKAKIPLENYDALLFSIIKFDLQFPPKPKKQLWIAHCGGKFLGRKVQFTNTFKKVFKAIMLATLGIYHTWHTLIFKPPT